MPEELAGLIGVAIGGGLTILGSVFGSYWGPKKLEERKERLQEKRADGPRKGILKAMLEDERWDARYLKTLRTVVGCDEDECRRLLIEVDARGLTLEHGEAWALLSRRPVSQQ